MPNVSNSATRNLPNSQKPKKSQHPQPQSLHDRTMIGLQNVMEHTMKNVRGFEQSVVSRAAQMLYPRLEQRIRSASEENLRTELKYLYEILGGVLQVPPPDKPPGKNVSSKRKGRKKSRG